jgi:hypothetical protein
MTITDRLSSFFSDSEKEERRGDGKLPDLETLQRKTKTRAAETSKLTHFKNLSQDIDPDELKRAYKYESCTHKAINKISNDCFEKWFELTGLEEEELEDRVAEVAEKLIERTDMKQKLPKVMRQAAILGTGYGEIVFKNDSADVGEEPNAYQIEDIVLVDSETIGPYVDPEVGSDTHGEIIYYEQEIGGETIKIHPDRIISFPWITVGTEAQGVPAIQPVYNVVKSKILLDQLSGSIPEAVVSQLVTLIIQGADKDRKEKALEKLKEMEDAGRFVGDENMEFEIHEGGDSLNIEPYSEHVVQQLATGLGIPKTLMLGAGAGEIATAQVNLKDYYSDIRNIQKRFESVIKQIVDKEFELQGIDAEYKIDWNDLYTEDEKESEIMLNNSRSARNLVGPQVPIMDADEAREVIFDMEPREETEEDQNEDLPY